MRLSPLAHRLATTHTHKPWARLLSATSSSHFHELRERSLLRHVVTNATENQPESVLQAMDDYWDTYFNGAGTAEWKLRSNAIDAAIKNADPNYVMELGTYCGYTAVRVGRLLKPGSTLVSIEIEPLFAAIATKVVEYAGLSDTITVRIGSVMDQLGPVQDKVGKRPLDALLLDHDMSSFLPDLRYLEEHKAIGKNTAVLCDWNMYPGADDPLPEEKAPRYGEEFLQYMKKFAESKDLNTTRHVLNDKDVFSVSTWSGVV